MKKSFLLIALCCGVMLTGCAKLTDVTEQQSDELAEYVAGTVLRYTKNYDEALIYPDTTKEEVLPVKNTSLVEEKNDTTKIENVTDETVKTPQNTETTQVKEEEVTEPAKDSVSVKQLFEEVIGNKYVVSYKGNESYKTYPKSNESLTLEAEKGYKFITFKFNVKNTTKKESNVNLVNKDITYSLSNKSGVSYKPCITLLTNDIQYFKAKIGSNKSKKAVIIFQVPEDVKEKDLTLSINYKDKSAVIALSK